MSAAQGIVDFIRGFGEHKRAGQVDEVLRNNYLDHPQEAIAQIVKIDPRLGISLHDQEVARQTAAQDRQRKLVNDQLATVAKYGRGIDFTKPEGMAQFDALTPTFADAGVDPALLAHTRDALAKNPSLFTTLDDDAFKAFTKDQFTTTIATPGSHALRGGKVVDAVPYAIKPVTTQAGATTVPFDQNTGQFITSANPVQPAMAPTSPASSGHMGALTVDALRPHFKAQESSDNYAAVNKGTGALGAYQIMPETGAALAKRLGLPWRPDMMRHDDPASRRYQDAIGGAAIQEAIDHGDGDITNVASYYHGGSNRAIWGPKTQTYAQQMAARLGVGGGAATPASTGPVVSPTQVSVPPKPAASKGAVRTLSPQEASAAGFPAGAVVQQDSVTGEYKVKSKGETPTQTLARMKWDAAIIDKGTAARNSYQSLAEKARAVLNSPGLDTAVGNIQGRLPGLLLGQEGQNAINGLDNLKSNVGLTALQAFKNMSAQGASGFGNLSNEEGRRLEGLFGVLDRTSSEAQIRQTLRDIIRIAEKGAARANDSLVNGTRYSPSGAAIRSGGPAEPKVGEVRNGYRFRGGNPAVQGNWEKVR